MNILIFLHDDDKFGAPAAVFEMALHLQEDFGCHPIVITPKYNGINKKCSAHAIENYAIKYGQDFYFHRRNLVWRVFNQGINKIKDFNFYKELERKVQLETIDVVYSAVCVVSKGMVVAKKYQLPHIWHFRELSPFKECFTDRDISKINHYTYKVVTISRAVADYWLNSGISKDKVKLIYDGIEPIAEFRERKNVEGTLKVVVVGRLSKAKGTDLLIDAISLLDEEIRKNIRIDVYGEPVIKNGRYIKTLMQKISDHSLDGVINLRGFLNHASLILKNYDVGLMNSVAEAFGRTTCEYMAAGLAVIATNSGANPEIIDDEKDGLLYESGNPKNLAEKILHLYHNQEEINSLGARASQKIREKFSTTREVNELNALFWEAVNQRKKKE